MDMARIIRRDLSPIVLITLIVAALMTVASAAGIVYSDRVYPGMDAKLVLLLIGQDVLNLVVGLPMLLGFMWLARRGSLLGMLLWPGALFYVLYDYGYYVLGAPLTALFLPYIALMTLSGYSAVGIVASIESQPVREHFAERVLPRLTGGFLAGVALLFMALWTALTIAVLSGAAGDPILRVVVTMDLTVQLPALLGGGILLWRRAPFGYVVAPGLLLQAGAYLVGLSLITIWQEYVMGIPFDPMAILPGFVVGGGCLALLATFARGAAARGRAPSAAMRMQMK